MARYQQADTAATAELIQRLSPMLLRFLGGSGGTRPRAEDLLQECWLRIHRSRHTYRAGAPVLPWVFAIALEEVARATGSTIGSVKQKAHRAYAKLRESLSQGAAR